MDTLLIPCWGRPEFLHHTLDNLVRTGDLHTVHVIFKMDHAYHADIPKVIESWREHLPSFTMSPTPRTGYTVTKQSHNLLTGYAQAASLSTGLVFMVEEDIMVSRDFFRYHRAIHAKEKVFVSLSTKNHNRQLNVTDDPEAYYLSTGDYCSLGACFRKEVIEQLILPHANKGYYKNPRKYCETTFPNSTLHLSMVEQDGLIRRIQASQHLPTVYPHVPRAFHAGIYGYNRRKYVTGTTRQKMDRLAAIIYDPDMMRLNSLNPAYYADSEPVNLDIPQWTHLKHVPA